MSKRNNCLSWAWSKWSKRKGKRHGYLIIRSSDYGWWWHFMWSENLVIFEQFTPDEDHRKRKLPPLWFRGHIKKSVSGEA